MHSDNIFYLNGLALNKMLTESYDRKVIPIYDREGFNHEYCSLY